MPVSKRARTLRTALQPSPQSPPPPPPPPQHKEHAGTATVDEVSSLGDIISDGGSPGTAESFDEALFDEEEAPGAADDLTSASPEQAKTSPRTGKNESRHGHYGGYNALKSFRGQMYSGMAVGGSHTWNYDQGVWKETKEEPDLWKIDFKTTKRRARSAPRGSGAPVGTEYHWLIVAHQYVTKIDANTYETRMCGSKYKLAHKAASSKTWSVPTVKGQREREIELLEDARRRVQKLPPVLASEKVKTTKTEKGQQKLDSLFAKAGGNKQPDSFEGKKRKRAVDDSQSDPKDDEY